MFGRPQDTSRPSNPNCARPWSVRAELTVRRPSPIIPSTAASVGEFPAGVRMTYSFVPSPLAAGAPAMAPYAFHRGNLRFTSTPPPQRSFIPIRTPRPVPAEPRTDSGYNSNQSSDKRCTSTYSIVLAGNKDKGNLPSRLPFPRPWSSYCQQQQQSKMEKEQFASNYSARQAKVATQALADSRDVASQTTDIEAKLSPVAARKKVKRKTTTPGTQTTGDETEDSNLNRISRTPTTTTTTASSTKSPTPPTPTVSDSSTNTSNTSDKRKRTVHIDVYCTGTDDSSSSSSSSSEDSSSSSSQDIQTQSTVFESADVRVTHSQAKSNILPRGFQDDNAFMKRASERRCESFKSTPMRMPSLTSTKGYDSDDVLSSLYPSRFSSYSRLKDFESSVPWSTTSSRSGLALDDDDSTSWKDTVSDMESLVHSKASIDSFDYADSLDQERIRRLESAWNKKKARTPETKQKHLLQGKVMKDFADSNTRPVTWSSESSDSSSTSSDDDGDEVVLSFRSNKDNTSIVQGKLTLCGDAPVIDTTTTPAHMATNSTSSDQETESIMKEVKKSIFRDRIGPFGSVSPSPPPSKVQSRMTSPFTTPQGEKTDHIIKASIFGRVVNTFRKPGHHVGPAKNPICSCEHCRRHFEELALRGRSRSLEVVERRRSSTNSSTN